MSLKPTIEAKRLSFDNNLWCMCKVVNSVSKTWYIDPLSNAMICWPRQNNVRVMFVKMSPGHHPMPWYTDPYKKQCAVKQTMCNTIKRTLGHYPIALYFDPGHYSIHGILTRVSILWHGNVTRGSIFSKVYGPIPSIYIIY